LDYRWENLQKGGRSMKEAKEEEKTDNEKEQPKSGAVPG
jgi:hypothetical protein